MHRQIVYTGAIPQDLDLLLTNKNTMIALGMLAEAILGTTTLVDGLPCTPTGPASLDVLIGPGSIMTFANVDGTAFGSVGSDTTHQIVKQGISLGTLTLLCPAPSTVGQSKNYLIQAAYQDVDAGSVVLPYYNAADPAVAFNGPANSGTSQNTIRQGQCVVNVKAGTSATTGTQTTPSPDAGFTGLWVVTVANGQAAINSGDIVAVSTVDSSPFILEKLKDKLSLAAADARYSRRVSLSGNTTYHVDPAGNDSTGDGSSGKPWLTIQKAVDFLQQNIEVNGHIATIQLADGTYAGLSATFPFVGGNVFNVIINGNAVTPSNTIIQSTSNNPAVAASGAGCGFTIQNCKIQNTSTGNCIDAVNLANIFGGAGLVFGACGGIHLHAADVSHIFMTSSYTIVGNANTHIESENNSCITTNAGITVTLTGTPVFAVYAAALANGTLYVLGTTFSGSATGPRYVANANGVIKTNGAGATYLPGNSAGSVATGGAYV